VLSIVSSGPLFDLYIHQIWSRPLPAFCKYSGLDAKSSKSGASIHMAYLMNNHMAYLMNNHMAYLMNDHMAYLMNNPCSSHKTLDGRRLSTSLYDTPSALSIHTHVPKHHAKVKLMRPLSISPLCAPRRQVREHHGAHEAHAI